MNGLARTYLVGRGPYRDAAGRVAGVFGVSRGITGRLVLEERLQHQALHDALTGLPNRVLFEDRLLQALRRAKRAGGGVAVLFVDLDDFKVVNDSLGHKAGDELLVLAGGRMRGLIRPEDTVARLGGDEFVFLLEGTDAEGAARVAERVLEELRAPFSVGGRRGAAACCHRERRHRRGRTGRRGRGGPPSRGGPSDVPGEGLG